MTRLPQISLPTLPQLPGLPLPGGGPGTRRKKRSPAAQAPEEPDITPEEERSLLSKVLGAGTYVAESLNKPGLAVRGMLAGLGPEQLLHAVPFSETRGFAPKEQVSGRKLLQGMGMVGANKPGLDWGDVAGFAAEVLTDPLLLLTGPLGTVSKGATAATKGVKSLEAAQTALKATRASLAAGKVTGLGRLLKTPAGVAAQIRSGERGLLGLKLPFAAEPFVSMGQGSKAGAWAVEKMFYGGGHLNPFIWMRGIFSHTGPAKNLGEFFTRHVGAIQRGKDLGFAESQLLADAMVDVGTALGREEPRLMAKFAELAQHHQGRGDAIAFETFTRAAVEARQGLPKAADLADVARRTMQIPADVPLDDLLGGANDLAQGFYRYADGMVDMKNAAYARLDSLGLDIDRLESSEIYGRHFPRRAPVLAEARAAARRAGGGKQRIDDFYQFYRHREMRDVPGMTEALNGLARNSFITGVGIKDYAKAGKAMFTPEELAGLAAKGQTVTKAMGRERFRRNIQGRLQQLGVPTQDIQKDIPLMQDVLAWKEHFERPFKEYWASAPVNEAGQLLDEAGEVVLKKAQPISEASEMLRFRGGEAMGKTGIRQLVDRFRRMPETVRERGLFDRRPLEDLNAYMHSVLEWESNLRSMHNFLGQPGVIEAAGRKADWIPLAEAWAKVRLPKGRGALTDTGLETFVKSVQDRFPGKTAQQLVVHPKAVNVLQNYLDIGRPRYKAGWQQAMDKVNGLFRGWLFMAWPASHVRNLGGGTFNNWADGRASFPELLGGINDSVNYLKGKGTLRVEALLPELLKGTGRDLEFARREWPATAGAIGRVPQLQGRGIFGHVFRHFAPAEIKERGVRAALGFEKVTPEMTAAGVGRAPGAVMRAGIDAYNTVEFINRVSYAEVLAKKGFSDAEILHRVSRTQFNYSLASPFEREYMQRGVLFWQFPRNNVPYILSNILERPGGRTAQTLRAMRAARGEQEEYTPEMLQESLGVRLPGGTEQAAQFIRQSGIPVEDLNRIALEGGLPGARTVEKGLSTLHPLLQMPLELAAGKQFYTGRKLADLWSPSEALTGRKIRALDALLHYGPWSRGLREVAGIADARKNIWQKAASALTGFKVSTYDLEALREQDLRRAIERELKKMPEVYEITTPYVPAAKRERAGPEVQRKLKQLRAVTKRIRNLREERAKRMK